MALTVSFYTFSKKVNSTSRPATDPVITVSCVLKDNSGVINPVLEITTSVNPGNLNYCYIQQFSRYYWVNDWTWIIGRWEVSLSVDVLATFRQPIAYSNKYVLRCAQEYDKRIVDTLYPEVARREITKREVDFSFAQDISNGIFILGIVSNRNPGYFGAVKYYGINPLNIQQLLNFMFPDASETWNVQGAIQYTTESLIRSIYNPFDYIVSCKWYPKYSNSVLGTNEDIWFGNYNSHIQGKPLKPIQYWDEFEYVAYLPTGFINKDAKERTAPYCKITVHFEPWGIIEINPGDFDLYNGMVINIIPDYTTGKAILKLYEGNTEIKYKLLHESIANLAVPLTLAKSNVDVQGFANSVANAVYNGVVKPSTGDYSGILQSAGAVIDAAANMFPRISGISGTTGQFAGLDGICTVIIDMPKFVEESNGEFGKPLYDIRRLGDLGGYIKCGDGDIDISGCYLEELESIKEFLTSGFYMEV